MGLNQVIKKIHRYLESNENGERIVYEDMAEKFGISTRAYSEYYRGKKLPLGMKVLLRMLNDLKDDQVLEVVRMWSKEDTAKETLVNYKKNTCENISKE